MTFYPQNVKENAIKVGVKFFITVVNSCSSAENADISIHSGSNESLLYYH